MNSNEYMLCKLSFEHPELPIVPMVDTEVVCSDGYGYCMGRFGPCEVREYAIDEWYEDGIVRFKDDREEANLIESIAENKYEGTEGDYVKAKKEAAALWKKAIIVYIELPDLTHE